MGHIINKTAYCDKYYFDNNWTRICTATHHYHTCNVRHVFNWNIIKLATFIIQPTNITSWLNMFKGHYRRLNLSCRLTQQDGFHFLFNENSSRQLEFNYTWNRNWSPFVSIQGGAVKSGTHMCYIIRMCVSLLSVPPCYIPDTWPNLFYKKKNNSKDEIIQMRKYVR